MTRTVCCFGGGICGRDHRTPEQYREAAGPLRQVDTLLCSPPPTASNGRNNAELITTGVIIEQGMENPAPWDKLLSSAGACAFGRPVLGCYCSRIHRVMTLLRNCVVCVVNPLARCVARAWSVVVITSRVAAQPSGLTADRDLLL